jgi:hypothetical protein
MIQAYQLFARDAYAPSEKKILKAANKTARDMFRKRYSPELRDHWDLPVDEVTLDLVEKGVIESILQKYHLGAHSKN